MLLQRKTQIPLDVVTFTEEILNGKLHFLCSDLIGELAMEVPENEGEDYEGLHDYRNETATYRGKKMHAFYENYWFEGGV